MKKTGRHRLFPLCVPKKTFAAFLLFALFQARDPVPAEEAPPPPSETGRFFQRLGWKDVEFAAWYEVTVEAGEAVPGGGAGAPAGDSGIAWRELIRERRELSFIDCSLVPGRYRFRVQAFDVLGRGGEVSEWIPFEVRPALGGGPAQRLSWTEAEFTAACVVVVERQAEGEPSAGERAAYREVLRELRGREGFIEVSLPPGKYRFRVGAYDALGRPGEVSGWEYFEILAAAPEPEKPAPLPGESVLEQPSPKIWEGLAEVLYAPLFPLPFSHFNRTYDAVFQPAGAALKFGMLFPAGQRHALGFDFSPSWNYLYANKPDYDVLSQLMTLHLNLVYRRAFSALALQAGAGGGLSLLYDFHFEHSGRRSGEAISTWIPSVSAGLSLQWFFRRPFYLSLGLEYLQIFSVDNLFLNFIRPSAGAG
ncbi:MAG: hypothetical protein LBP27_02155, partial [Treponema sp.]|nr:hypothetical protein [Treponema sp.]